MRIQQGTIITRSEVRRRRNSIRSIVLVKDYSGQGTPIEVKILYLIYIWSCKKEDVARKDVEELVGESE